VPACLTLEWNLLSLALLTCAFLFGGLFWLGRAVSRDCQPLPRERDAGSHRAAITAAGRRRF
jgi:hypothetical protein